MNKKLLTIGLGVLMLVIVILAITVYGAVSRSNETIARVDRHIEEAMR